MHKVLLSFTSCHDQDGGSARLATLSEALDKLASTNGDLVGEIPLTAQSFDYYEFGETGHQLSWGDSVSFDYHEHLKEDSSRFELRVDGETVVSRTEGAEEE